MAFSCILMFGLIIFSTLLISLPSPQYTILVPTLPFSGLYSMRTITPSSLSLKAYFSPPLGPKIFFDLHQHDHTWNYIWARMMTYYILFLVLSISKFHDFIFLNSRIKFRCIYVPYFIIHSSLGRHLAPRQCLLHQKCFVSIRKILNN